MPPPRAKAQSNHPAISRILVATDFSPQAEMALRWARRLADAFAAKLVLLHVIDVSALGTAGFTLVGPMPVPPLLTEARQEMQRWQQRVPDAEVVIQEGSPRPLIVEAALELRCQLIVMGTHGRSGLAQLLMGSVAEYVVRYSKVPVLTVRKH
jgi:nucleotide-binding universal stress UspA family protein